MDESLIEVAITSIELDPNQPRKELGDLEALKRSIQENRMLHPPLVTPIGPDRYRLVVGERRYVAVVDLGHTTIWVIVRVVEEEERLELQLVENLQRKDLDPFELGDGFRRLMEQRGRSEEEVGAKVGKSQDYISSRLTIAAGIPEEIRAEYYATSRRVRASVLLEIARAEGVPAKRRMWEKARAGRYTVKQARAERATQGKKGGEAGSSPPKPATLRLDSGSITFRCDGDATLENGVKLLLEGVAYLNQRIADRQYLADRRAGR